MTCDFPGQQLYAEIVFPKVHRPVRARFLWFRVLYFFLFFLSFILPDFFCPVERLEIETGQKDCAAKLLTAIDPILWAPSCMATQAGSTGLSGFSGHRDQ